MRWAIGSLLAAMALAACTPAADPLIGATPTAAPAAADAASDAVRVSRRDFQIEYVLDAVTEASGAVRVGLAPGLAWANSVADGTIVEGDVIGLSEVSPSAREALEGAGQGRRIATAQLRRLEAAAGEVEAPASGDISVDPDGAEVTAPGVDVVVQVSGIQHLRLSSVPIEGIATVETVVGRRDVPCAAMWLVGQVPGDERGATVRCRLPGTTETVPGLRATLRIKSEVILDAQVVPDRMLGTDNDGYTLTVDQGDGRVEVPVEVGAGDGVVRVILTPLPDGAVLVAPGTP